MKKLLLSLAVAAGAAFTASAEEVTITMTSQTNYAEFTIDNFTFKALKNNGGNAPTYNANGKDMRLYAKNTLEIVSPSNITMQKIVFNISTQGKAQQSTITCTPGQIEAQTSGGEVVTWNGEAKDVIFTVGDKNDFGTNTSKTAGQFDFSSIKITYTQNGASKKNAELKFDGTSATVALGEKTFPGLNLTKATTAAVNYESTNPEVATVDHTTGVVTLVALGTTVIEAQTSENDEYYEGIATYTLTVLSDDVVYTDACTTADCGFTSIYATDSFNPWSIDATYGLKASAFKSNKSNASDAVMASPVLDLTGRKNCTLSFEHVLNQFKLNNVMLSTVDEALQYISVVAREEGATEWTKLSNPVLPEAYAWSPWTKSGDIDLSAFDGKNAQIGFRYISTTEIAGTWEIKNVEVKGTKDPSTGVVDTFTDENAPAVYYNLQGVRIDNPSKGLYIKVQGSKTTKVLVK